MHFLKTTAVLVLFLFGCKSVNNLPKEYDYTPTLLHASSAKQHDSIGFNIVRSLRELLYPRILTGDLPVWQTSQKQIRVNPEYVKNLEKTATTPFVAGKDLFIHEVWRMFKRNFDFGILGFSFNGSSKTGQKINYGYIDASDVINLLKSRAISNNANGSGYITYWDVLLSKKYSFNLVQFGRDYFKDNPMRAFEILAQALYSENVLRDFKILPNDKRLEYKVLNPNINTNSENKAFYSTLNRFINDNKQLVMNAGGNKFMSHLTTKKLVIDNIVIVEKWTKNKGLILQELEYMDLYFGRNKVTFNKEVLQSQNIRIGLEGLEEYLTSKRFRLVLQQINDQEILPQNSPKYYDRLKTNNWNKIKND